MFLSIVTRCYKRPYMLEQNRKSVAAQTCQDFEHIFLVDDIGRGVGWANGQFHRHRDEPRGDYVLMLDDDDVLSEPTAIEHLKEAAVNSPDLVMCKFDYGSYGILPTPEMWQMKWPKQTHVGTSCFITRRDIWHDNVQCFEREIAGDYWFLYSIWPDLQHTKWLDFVIGRVQRISRGAPEYAH